MAIKQSSNGFTIVEMVVVVPIVILVIGVFISAIVNMTGEVLITRENNTMAYNIQNAMSQIKQDVSLGIGFLATNNVSLTSPQGYTDDTTEFNNADTTKGNMLILNVYATSENPNNSESEYIYMDDQPNKCSSNLITDNSKLKMNVVYFTKTDSDGDISLWRRVLAPLNYKVNSCSVPWQRPSCSIDQTGSICETDDTKLVDNISNINGFSINYYTEPDSTTPIASATDSSLSDSVRQTALGTASSVSVTITTKNEIIGEEVSQSSTVRINNSNNDTTSTVINI